MLKLNRYVDLDELNGTESDGQTSDYWAALESGDTSEWDYGVIDYECTQCGAKISEMNDSVKTYDGLIQMWHEKARRGDFFSRYVFEYIAFNAYLKSRVVLEVVTDRKAIQRLKQNEKYRVEYLEKIKSSKELTLIWKELIVELERESLHNSSRDIDNPELDKYWNYSEDKLTPEGIAKKPNLKEGVVHSLEDWPNMVEFWYSTRNNLFHGGKNPNVDRDIFLVEHAFKTLSSFMKMQVPGLGTDLKIF